MRTFVCKTSLILCKMSEIGRCILEATKHFGNSKRTSRTIGRIEIVTRKNKCRSCRRYDSFGAPWTRFTIDYLIEVSFVCFAKASLHERMWFLRV